MWKKQIIGWLGAFILSFLIVNGVMFFYFKRPAWISRDEGASTGIYYPERNIVYAYEGFGINETDQNGYVNPNVELESKYILVMGSSHTQAKEVMAEERYSNLINQKITDENKLYVYNIAIDGNYYPTIVKHFEAALQEFPNSEAVIIEIGDTEYEIQELQDSIHSVPYSKDTVGSALVENMTYLEKIKAMLKEKMSLVVLLAYKQLANIDLGIENMFWYSDSTQISEKKDTEYNKEYVKALENSLKKLKDTYGKPIIILYHPEVKLTKEGKMEIIRDSNVDMFKNMCLEYEISFLDMGDVFLQEFNSSLIYPYGFANTAPGTGHLNKEGHHMVADTLFEELSNYSILDKLKKGGNP